MGSTYAQMISDFGLVFAEQTVAEDGTVGGVHGVRSTVHEWGVGKWGVHEWSVGEWGVSQRGGGVAVSQRSGGVTVSEGSVVAVGEGSVGQRGGHKWGVHSWGEDWGTD